VVPVHENYRFDNKAELDSTTRIELGGTAVMPQTELDSIVITELCGTMMDSAPPPVYVNYPQELSALSTSRSDGAGTRILPRDVGPAIVIPTPYSEEDSRLEQLRAQRAAVAREREHREEINGIRAEEERLDRAIAELERPRY
jgi:hypothetical protein